MPQTFWQEGNDPSPVRSLPKWSSHRLLLVRSNNEELEQQKPSQGPARIAPTLLRCAFVRGKKWNITIHTFFLFGREITWKSLCLHFFVLTTDDQILNKGPCKPRWQTAPRWGWCVSGQFLSFGVWLMSSRRSMRGSFSHLNRRLPIIENFEDWKRLEQWQDQKYSASLDSDGVHNLLCARKKNSPVFEENFQSLVPLTPLLWVSFLSFCLLG